MSDEGNIFLGHVGQQSFRTLEYDHKKLRAAKLPRIHSVRKWKLSHSLLTNSGNYVTSPYKD